MSEMQIKLASGVTLGFTQAAVLSRRIKELEPHVHWHANDCGCCVTVHGRDCAYVIGPDGGETFFPHRGCDCLDD